MKPWVRVGESTAPDGTPLTLNVRDGEYLLLAGSMPLMSSREHRSEDALAALACERIAAVSTPSVLLGGLGMGFTLRAALDHLPSSAHVVVAELIPAVVEWNRGPLGTLTNHPLADARVRVEQIDVCTVLHSHRDAFDAVLLDVDNGPNALVSSPNDRLYGDDGIDAARQALKRGGVLAVWAAAEDRRFATRLRSHGFTVDVRRGRGRAGRWSRGQTILLAYQSAGR